ncbi:hypothetical protein SAMN04488128_1011594 [Chitinophaga eiseniae]|uniref:Uncharacterized protein n=1 Tax=Chitinophaga eiseniae TaxID=634771 RepID=A0A1T4NHL8_9BACT|nr:hypothetical protein SAMN04488128_1011594 [Chitinophaga eiseniae]
MNTLFLILYCLAAAGLAVLLMLAALLYLMMIQHQEGPQ